MRRLGLFLLVALSACSSSQRSIDQQFRIRSVTVDGERYFYRVWLPRHYTHLRRWPVILYLHGSGERGADNLAQLSNGLPVALQQYGSRFSSIVVIPQCRDGYEWYGAMEKVALAALDSSMAEFRGDRRHVVLTGISMGGAGTWYMARNPHRFAAIVPVSAEVVRQGNDPWPQPLPPDLDAILSATDPHAALAQRIGKTPAWVFHGADDDEIPVAEARQMVEVLRAVDPNVKYTEYPNVGHNAWDLAYDDPQLAAWIAAQQRHQLRP